MSIPTTMKLTWILARGTAAIFIVLLTAGYMWEALPVWTRLAVDTGAGLLCGVLAMWASLSMADVIAAAIAQKEREE